MYIINLLKFNLHFNLKVFSLNLNMSFVNYIFLSMLITQGLHGRIIHRNYPNDILNPIVEPIFDGFNDGIIATSLNNTEDSDNPIGYELFGDTWLRSSVVQSIRSHDNEVSVLNVVKDKTLRWPKGGIQFQIDPKANYSFAQKNIIYAGMGQWQKSTCIRFYNRDKTTVKRKNYIFIRNGAGCDSHIGMIGGRQVLNLNKAGCLDAPSVAHELGHAIGLDHEHSRTDRDNYIRIIWKNIQNGTADQFYKEKQGEYQILGPYDTQSVMHYGSLSFSKDGESPTMLIKKTNGTIAEIEDRPGVTKTDAKIVNKAYNNCQ